MPMLKSARLRSIHEKVAAWCHPEHPFRDPQYALCAPAFDLTPEITDCLLEHDYEAIRELWALLTPDNVGTKRVLENALRRDLPDWIDTSNSARAEIKAIQILLLRLRFALDGDMTRLAAALVATTIGSRAFNIQQNYLSAFLDMVRDEMSRDSALGAKHGVKQASEIALETAMSALNDAEACAERIKSVPPITRLVVHDFLTRGWGNGLRLNLYYPERMYGCGVNHNQIFVDWLGFFDSPTDDSEVPKAISKDILQTALQERGVPHKKSAPRAALIDLARTTPGLIASLIAKHAPDKRDIRSEWARSVMAWSERITVIDAVGAAVMNAMAQELMK